MLVQCITEFNQGKEEKYPTFIILFVCFEESLGPACKKENRSFSRCQDDFKTKDIHT